METKNPVQNIINIQEYLEKQVQLAMSPSTQDRVEAQHAKGKLTARERIDVLLDPDSFEEIGMYVTHRSSNFDMDKKKYYCDGVITGHGTINGRLVFVYSQDFTVLGGSLGEAHAKKICNLLAQA